MRQRIAIAIALACRPKLLIADEPTTALDVTVQAGILRLLDRLRRENDLAVILITHDLGVMSSIADRVSIFYAGRVVESGAREDVLQRPRHPYTRALLDALPHPEAAHDQPLVAIPGAPPTPGRDPRRAAPSTRAARTLRDDVPRATCRRSSRRRTALLACPVDPFAGRERARAHRRRRRLRAARRRPRPRRRRREPRASSAGRSSASSASRAAASRRSPAPRSASCRPAGGLGRLRGPRGRAARRAAARPRRARPAAARLPEPVLVAQPAPEGRRAARRRARHARLAPAAAAGARARAAASSSGLPATAADRFPHEFSGGQRQRIAIARTLAADPSVIVLDEPLASLDASAQAQLANLLVELSRELGLGLLLISHDLAIVRHVADDGLGDVPRRDGRDRRRPRRSGSCRSTPTARR